MKYRYKCADGSYKYILDRAILLYDKNLKPERMIGAMQDVTYQQEEEMRIDRAIISAQEEERKQIGMELHDNVNQLLSASLLYLSMADGNNEKNISFDEIVQNTRHNVSEAIADIRRLSHQLAPANYEHIALNEVFESLINSIKAARGFDIVLEVNGFEGILLQNDIQLNLYRVLQEQLSNIVKHSKAKKVDVLLNYSNGKARLLIADDGVGFDTANIKTGIGLENIRRRVKLFAGHIEIISSPGKGCRVLLEMPITQSVL
jgi:signal transduction histidine kinase